MGLTVYYKLAYPGTALGAKRQLAKLQRRAAEMDFECVDPVREIDIPENRSAWMVGLQYLDRGDYLYRAVPLRGWFFEVLTAEGSEWARIGLAEYPKTVTQGGRRIFTKLPGWNWSDSCKTQYASNPNLGGFDNFRRAHVGLIELLDQARELGIATMVVDEGHYDEHRDIERLREDLGQWNMVVAALVGALKDALPFQAEAPITEYPNFEHLEADARSNL